MHNIALTNDKLSTIIMSIDLEVHRIKQYYDFVLQHGHSEMSLYDSKRLEELEAISEELKKERGY
jgi:hypothetical protein